MAGRCGNGDACALEQGFRGLPISLEHAERAGQLRIAHMIRSIDWSSPRR
jgi:hypothetical protein